MIQLALALADRMLPSATFKHSVRVSHNLHEHYGADGVVVALLHDVVEDSAVTVEMLGVLFGKEIAETVEALTRHEGEEYFDYIERVRRHGAMAVAVKLADANDNLYGRPQKPVRCLITRYERVIQLLKGAA